MALYLLHFDRPYQHARHYLGYSADIPSMHRRIDEHYAASRGDGKHHRLVTAAVLAGISFTLAKVWPEGTRAQERAKKNHGHTRICPVCRDEAKKRDG